MSVEQNKDPLNTDTSNNQDNNEQNNNGGFSLTRTFGGEKARMMFPLKDFD